MEKSEVRQRKSFLLERFQLVCALCYVQLFHCILEFVHYIKDNEDASEWEYTTDWGLMLLIRLWVSLVLEYQPRDCNDS